MHYLFIEPIVNSGLVRAFCWTLIHSCWQGLLLAVLTGLIVLITRRSRPAARYYLFSGLFLLFFLTVCGTFLRELGSDRVTAINITEPGVVQVVHIGVQEAVAPGVAVSSGRVGALVAFFNRNAGLIVGIWMFVFLMKSVRIASNIITVNRIRNHNVNVPVGEWSYRLQGMAMKLGIRRSVRLLESPLIAAPMTAGFLKPVILAPLGLLANLPPSQVEAILLHELAHIRRKDYFINLIQTFLESLFFFNPAVYWLSSLIRDERESCCDDIAIGQSKSKKDFIHALVSFHEYMQPGVGAMAFPGAGGNQLLERVRRIVGRDDRRLRIQEKGFLLVCVIVAAGLMMAFTRMDREEGAVLKPIEAKEVVLEGVRDRSVPDLASAGIVRSLAAAGGMLDTVPKKRLAEGAGKDSVDTRSEEMVALLREQQALREEEAKLRRQQEMLRKRRAELMERARKSNLKPGENEGRMELQKDSFRTFKSELEKRDEPVVDLVQNGAVLHLTQVYKDSLRSDKQQLLLHLTKLKEEGKDKMHEVVDPIIEEILSRNIATDAEHLKFSLDKDGFDVNGMRQPTTLFEMMKAKYLTDDRNSIKYARDGGSTSIAVSAHK